MSQLLLKDLTPKYYTYQSRDFQVFERLFDLALNNSRLYIDSMEFVPFSKGINKRLLELVARTLGFYGEHKYTSEDLYSIMSAYKYLIRNKGTLKAIKYACYALLNSQNIKGDVDVNVTNYDEEETDRKKGTKFEISVNIDYRVSDLILLVDLFEYIKPAGYTITINRVSRSSKYTNRVAVSNTHSTLNSVDTQSHSYSKIYKIDNDKYTGKSISQTYRTIVTKAEGKKDEQKEKD